MQSYCLLYYYLLNILYLYLFLLKLTFPFEIYRLNWYENNRALLKMFKDSTPLPVHKITPNTCLISILTSKTSI